MVGTARRVVRKRRWNWGLNPRTPERGVPTWAASHHDERHEGLHDLAALIRRHVPNSDNATIRFGAGRAHIQDFRFEFQHVARTDWLRPAKLIDSKPDRSTFRLKFAGNEKTHAHGRSVPSARGQSFKDALVGGLRIEMKWLRVELPREIENAFLSNLDGLRSKPIADFQVFEVQLAHS